MSLHLLRDNVRKRLIEKIDASMSIVTNQVFRPASALQDNVLPAQTLEEIAVYTLTMNAAAKAFQEALKVLDDELKKIIDPASNQPAEPTKDDDTPVY